MDSRDDPRIKSGDGHDGGPEDGCLPECIGGPSSCKRHNHPSLPDRGESQKVEIPQPAFLAALTMCA